ncbi:hypothetical protein VMA_001430 [Vibrio mimicus VM223]|nr:hypothetical protein VMA_001430 [Vibrio mimicus VM223]
MTAAALVIIHRLWCRAQRMKNIQPMAEMLTNAATDIRFSNVSVVFIFNAA